MKDIVELRKEIDTIDKELKELFIKRMDVAFRISEYKKENGLPIFDPKREEELIDRIKKASDIEENLKPFYIDFVVSLMNISKEYQKTNK